MPAAGPDKARCGAVARHKKRAGLSDVTCQKVAGFGTNHLGVGRCKYHGGCTPIKHGRYSTIAQKNIKDLLDKVEEIDKDPLDMLPDLNLARAVLIDFINRYQDFSKALIEWHDSWRSGTAPGPQKPYQVMDIADASNMIERVARIAAMIIKIQDEGSIGLETFKNLQEQMAITVAKHVTDLDVLRKIENEWNDIRVLPGSKGS